MHAGRININREIENSEDQKVSSLLKLCTHDRLALGTESSGLSLAGGGAAIDVTMGGLD